MKILWKKKIYIMISQSVQLLVKGIHGFLSGIPVDPKFCTWNLISGFLQISSGFWCSPAVLYKWFCCGSTVVCTKIKTLLMNHQFNHYFSPQQNRSIHSFHGLNPLTSSKKKKLPPEKMPNIFTTRKPILHLRNAASSRSSKTPSFRRGRRSSSFLLRSSSRSPTPAADKATDVQCADLRVVFVWFFFLGRLDISFVHLRSFGRGVWLDVFSLFVFGTSQFLKRFKGVLEWFNFRNLGCLCKYKVRWVEGKLIWSIGMGLWVVIPQVRWLLVSLVCFSAFEPGKKTLPMIRFGHLGSGQEQNHNRHHNINIPKTKSSYSSSPLHLQLSPQNLQTYPVQKQTLNFSFRELKQPSSSPNLFVFHPCILHPQLQCCLHLLRLLLQAKASSTQTQALEALAELCLAGVNGEESQKEVQYLEPEGKTGGLVEFLVDFC